MLNDWQKLPETEKRERVTALVADLALYEVELHLMTDPDLPKKYGKAIKAAGGRYNEVRGGGRLHRYVTLPNTARELINKLVVEFGFWHGARSTDRVTMIARLNKLPTHVAVGSVTKTCEDPIGTFERQLARKALAARADGDSCGELTNADWAARDDKLRAALAEQKSQAKLAALLDAARPTSEDEFDTIAEALKVFAANPHYARSYLLAAQAMLERIDAARVEFVKPEPTLAESLDGRLPPLDAILANNTEKSS